MAYQGAARALGVDEILQLNLWAVRGLLPDVTIFLDLDPEVAFERRTGEPDRLEREPNSFQHRVREQYYELSKTYADRYRVIDASGDIESVQQQIRRALEPLVEEHLRANKVGNA